MAVSRGSLALSGALLHNRTLRRRLVGLCDVSEQTIRNWESGENSPKHQYRATLSEVAGVESQWWDEQADAPAATGTEGR